MKLINICNRVIEYSFYVLFFLVPLIIWGDTSELFEFNKMWFTFGVTILIAVAWFIKSIAQKRFRIQRTPLDVPILLFLLSQIISTIFSWDVHISIWGYYSRFNGGLLSIISYIFLYYAFVSNFITDGDPAGRNERQAQQDTERYNGIKIVKRLIFVSLFSGLIVSLWGLPSHFGYDPTCFVFRGNLDVSCWTSDFQPKVRIFSTLGQPDWLAAYLAILLPISIALFIKSFKLNRLSPSSVFYLLLSALFYIDLLFSGSRSGVLAAWISVILFLAAYSWIEYRKKAFKPLNIIIPIVTVLIVTFFLGQPFSFFNKFTFEGLKTLAVPAQTTNLVSKQTPPAAHVGELGGTDSGKIRILVWQGAIEAWKHYPIFGTGVETFAFAYYKYKSPLHNLTSEWNFLYNKAHNEYLNYLATTGAFGLGTYLLMIIWFLFISFKNHRQIQNSDDQNSKHIENLKRNLFGDWNLRIGILPLALIASYLSILITNFFGFSVVIVNIYLFMIPAFVFSLLRLIDTKKAFSLGKTSVGTAEFSPFQWVGIFLIILIGLYEVWTLFTFWNADRAYAYGSNLDRAGYYQQAYPYLHKAVSERGDEPVFKDELSVNDAVLAAQLLETKDTKTATETAATASTLAQEAIATSNDVVGGSSNNVVFWKSRVRIFYSLSQVDPRFLPMALTAIRRAAQLAPNDASILYNLGVLEGQNGNYDNAISALEKTIKIKPDYRDPYFALGLFYHQKALNKKGQVVDKKSQEKAVSQMKYILTNISTTDAQAKDALKSWGE